MSTEWRSVQGASNRGVLCVKSVHYFARLVLLAMLVLAHLAAPWVTNSPLNLARYSHLATVFVNGIPSVSRILLISPGLTQVALLNPTRLAGGEFQFSFTGTPGTSFTAMAATNVSLGASNWTVLGAATEISPGQFQFTYSDTTNHLQRFYRVSSP